MPVRQFALAAPDYYGLVSFIPDFGCWSL